MPKRLRNAAVFVAFALAGVVISLALSGCESVWYAVPQTTKLHTIKIAYFSRDDLSLACGATFDGCTRLKDGVCTVSLLIDNSRCNTAHELYHCFGMRHKDGDSSCGEWY